MTTSTTSKSTTEKSTDKISCKKELAIAYHDMKYNCAQAVACAYADEVGMDKATIFRVMEGFGLGMGCTEGTCGAISGAVALAGLKNSDGELDTPATKASTYQLSKEILTKFQEKNGATLCRDLKGVTNGGTPLRSCPDCIMDAVEIAGEVLGLQKQHSGNDIGIGIAEKSFTETALKIGIAETGWTS